MAQQKRRQSKNQLQAPYERFTHYLGIMHQKALELLDSLNDADRRTVSAFFEKYYPTKREHYWSITKLFCHAMYVPMFLQIGKKYFPKLIYVDTHSGPGLAKIGAGEDEIVLGSPLIALYWPNIVASQEDLPQFRNIINGFDELYFIDINPRNIDILERFIDDANLGKVHTYKSDVNKVLPHIDLDERTLIYMFIDPYGDLNSQLSYDALNSFLREKRADIMMAVFTANIARGLSVISDKYDLVENVEKLFGKGFCNSSCLSAANLCTVGTKKVNDVLEAYRCALKSLGYHRIETIPIRFERGILYYLILAVRGGSGTWVDGYIRYIIEKAPLDKYDVLKRLWLHVYKKQRSLFEFLNLGK